MSTLSRIAAFVLIFSTLTLPLFAATYDIREMTPEIQEALDGRKARYAEVQRLKSEGILAEDNQGYVKVVKSDSDAAEVADNENANRRVIYRAIVDQNNLGPGGMEIVEKTFAEVQREKAR